MRYVLIPVELCEYVLAKKLTRPFQLYILLKSLCSGKIKIPARDFETIAGILHQKSTKTVRTHLKKLQQLNFIGYNPKSQYYFIRGIDQIRQQLNLKSRTAVEFDQRNILDIQAFCTGAVCSYAAKQYQKRRWLSESKKSVAGSKHDRRPLSVYDVVATRLISRRLNVSVSTAHQLKKKAHERNFIRVVQHLKPLNISGKLKRLWKKAHPEMAGQLRVRDYGLWLQQPDEVIPMVWFKKRKKIEQVK